LGRRHMHFPSSCVQGNDVQRMKFPPTEVGEKVRNEAIQIPRERLGCYDFSSR
jgi:hypothetical protein